MDRELLLLGLLRREDMHGYQLHEFINQNMASCIDLKKPTAYYLLERMAEAGWITASAVQEGSRPARHVYQLTAEGEAHFQRLLRENLAAYHPVRFAGDIGLVFLDALPPAELCQLLEQRRAALQHELDRAQTAPRHAGSSQFVIEHLTRHLRSELDWLDELIQHLTTPIEE